MLNQLRNSCSNPPGLGGVLAFASLLLGITLLQQPPARAEPQSVGTGEPASVAPSKAATASASEICRVATQAAAKRTSSDSSPA